MTWKQQVFNEKRKLRVNLRFTHECTLEHMEHVKVRFFLSEIDVWLEHQTAVHASITGRFTWIGHKIEFCFRGQWFRFKLKAAEDTQLFECRTGGNERLTVAANVIFALKPLPIEIPTPPSDRVDAGSFGEVFDVTIPDMPSRLAVKVIPISSARGLKMHQIRQEIVANMLPIATIFNIFRWWTIEKQAVKIVSDYCERGNLRSADLTYLDSERQKELIWSVQALHKFGLIHMDIKPNNILVQSYRGHLILCDFGSTIMNGVQDKTRRFITQGWSPPERRSDHIDERYDLYSVGAVLLELNSKESRDDYGVLKWDLSQQLESCLDPDPNRRLNLWYSPHGPCAFLPSYYVHAHHRGEPDWEMIETRVGLSWDVEKVSAFKFERRIWDEHLLECEDAPPYHKFTSKMQKIIHNDFRSDDVSICHMGMTDGLCDTMGVTMYFKQFHHKNLPDEIAIDRNNALRYYMKLPSLHVTCSGYEPRFSLHAGNLIYILYTRLGCKDQSLVREFLTPLCLRQWINSVQASPMNCKLGNLHGFFADSGMYVAESSDILKLLKRGVRIDLLSDF